MAADAHTVTIAHVSDLHLGAHSPAAVRDLPADVAAARPTVTVVTGDLTMRARAGQFRQARAVIDALPEPRLVVGGNHDIPLWNVVKRLTRPYAEYRTWLDGDLDPVLDLDVARVQGLNSVAPWRWKSGRVTRRQIGWLTDGSPGVPLVVALHHPVSERAPAGVVGRGRLLAALARAGAEVVLAGHTHLPAVRRVAVPGPDGRRHDLIEVVAGTATSTRTRGTGQSWMLIQIDPEQVTVEQRWHDGAGWHAGPRTRLPRSARPSRSH